MPKPSPRLVAGKIDLAEHMLRSRTFAIDVFVLTGHTRRAAAEKVAKHPQLKDLPP